MFRLLPGAPQQHPNRPTKHPVTHALRHFKADTGTTVLNCTILYVPTICGYYCGYWSIVD